jgi:5-hydroxyisourate hydrolase-like protein (transthyretin family)
MVTIKIINSRTGNPADGVAVAVYHGMFGNLGKDGRTDRNGEVHLDVAPGDFKVTVGKFYAQNHTLGARVNVIYVDV